MEQTVKLSERLAAVGGLAAGVAHELRNPLASISGSIELLKNVKGLGAEDQSLMDIVIREVDRLNGLVTELVDFARPREPLALKTDLAALLGETVRVFRQDRTKPGISVAFTLPPGGLEVSVDPDQIRQVVWNLLRNAAEAMPDGGEIKVELSRQPDGVEVAVADSGVGIAPPDLERIFEPFFTTKTRGTGLGLALVHRIVTEHGGALAVDSQIGRGTRVSFRLANGIPSNAPAGTRS
jgi:two-component system sensor histidine kinase PilS (NtrC family)